MEIKVCGLINAENFETFSHLPIYFIGHIYHPPSSRHFTASSPISVKSSVKRVGVFVDQTFDLIQSKIRDWQLDVVQLHGNESADFAEEIKAMGVGVWKVVHLKQENFDWKTLAGHAQIVDRFLFDYKSDLKGGAGKKFDWEILNNYPYETPVMMAGGIGPEDAEKVKSVFAQHPFLVGIDLNSCFETKPGLKDVQLLSSFIQRLL